MYFGLLIFIQKWSKTTVDIIMNSLFFLCILFRKFYKNKKYWIVLKTYSISYEESIYWLWKLRTAYFGKSIWLVFIIFWWSLCCENKTFCIYQPLWSPNKRAAKKYCAYLKNHFLTFWVNAFMEIFNPTGSCYKMLDENETDMQIHCTILCQEFN